jgi:two-component system alkaline phosphatase synthesis response regulator PhoP
MSLGRVLVIEDEPSIRRGVADALGTGGYSALEAADGRTGLETALAASVDLVLLDLMLPGMDGLEVLEQIRAARPGLPVICLTAMGEPADRVRGLKLGADDYVVKPFGVAELLARIEAVLRRSSERPQTTGIVSLAGRTVDLDRREVTLADGEVRTLAQREAEVLAYLVAHSGRPASREELLRRVWGLDPRGVTSRTVDMAIARLREHLGDDASAGEVVRTVRGRGYMVVPDADGDAHP